MECTMKQLKKFDCSTAHEGIEVYNTIISYSGWFLNGFIFENFENSQPFSKTYEELCRNLMIFQQLEPICQLINSTFYMEFHLPLLIFLLICYILICKQHEKEYFSANRLVPATILNVRHMRVKTLFFTHYQNQCNSYGDSKRRLFIVRFPVARVRYPRFATRFQYFMAFN